MKLFSVYNMEHNRSQTPTQMVDGAAPAAPDTKTGAGAVTNTVPPTTTRAFGDAQAAQGGNAKIPGGGAVHTVPSHSSKKSMWGRKAAGKPAAKKPCTLPVHADPVQAKGRTPPATQGEAAAVVSVEEKTTNPEQTTAAEPVYDEATLRLNAGWTLPKKKAKKAKRVKRVVPEPDAMAGYHKKNKKQRRKSRQKRPADQDSAAPAPSLQQGVPQKGSAQAAAGAPVAGRTVPQKGPAQAVAGPLAAGRTVPQGKRANKTPRGCSTQETRPSTKRARLDETISPRGESKKRKTGPPGETPRIDYAEAVKADLLVAVTTATAEHLSPQQSEEVQHQMQRLLVKEAMQPGSSQSEGPQFRGKPVLTNGSLKLWCEDKATLEWLKRSVATITLSDGQGLVVKRPSELPRRVRIGILLPGIHENPQEVAHTLRYQNKWADIDRWLLHKFDKQATETFATLSIPETVVGPLMDRGRRLSFMLGSVYVKFEGSRGKYVENPPAETTAPTDAGTTAVPPTETATVTVAADAVAAPEPQAPEQTDPASETDEEELLLRDHSESGEECAEELGKLAIRREEGREEEMSTEEIEDDGAVPFFSSL